MKNEEIEKAIDQIKATMGFEDQELMEDEIEICKQILKGEITGEEARKKILEALKKHKG